MEELFYDTIILLSKAVGVLMFLAFLGVVASLIH